VALIVLGALPIEALVQQQHFRQRAGIDSKYIEGAMRFAFTPKVFTLELPED
jgi:hypothetical protein